MQRRNLAWLISVAIACSTMAQATTPVSGKTDAALAARVAKVLADTPLIDGHNDLPWELRARGDVDLRVDQLKQGRPADGQTPLMTDIPRMRAGGIGGQFWSVWIPSSTTGPAAVQMTMEEIDIVRSMVARYPEAFEMAYTADDIERIHREGRIASLVGIEGGHQINDSMAMLRQMYVLGARYMTLTHTSNNAWADSATADPVHHGLTPFGKAVVGEMNRLGMLVDLSHVSPDAMRQAIATSAAPVMFSHSNARALIDHPRGVPDDVLRLVAKNRGIVMVNFYSSYVSAANARWDADRAAEKARFNAPPYGGLYIGQPERAKAALAEWEKRHPAPVATLGMVADHIEHIRKVAGIENVGIGSDFDGVSTTPTGLDGVDKYPALMIELARRGWADAELAAVAGGNMLRVMREAEAVAKRLQVSEQPSMLTIDGKPLAAD
ncbi:MAG: dipeptidase [Thermomonas sp.]